MSMKKSTKLAIVDELIHSINILIKEEKDIGYARSCLREVKVTLQMYRVHLQRQ